MVNDMVNPDDFGRTKETLKMVKYFKNSSSKLQSTVAERKEWTGQD
jgi:hypothetical protein